MLPTGSLVMRVNADGSIPDINGLKRKDLALFIGAPICLIALGAPPIRLREPIRIGNDCATVILACTEKTPGKVLKCTATPP